MSLSFKRAVVAVSAFIAVGFAAAILLGGMNGGNRATTAQDRAETIEIDGSSTVYPITEAVAEEYQIANRGEVRVTVGVSGTGGGFRQFCRGEIDINDASRPITEEERELCAENGIKYIELPVALDALAVTVNPKNDWVQCMTVEQLRTIWEPEAQGKITNWSQINPEWPDRPLSLYGAGVDSGTYDYFTAAIVGKEHSSRGDYTASENDNVLVRGIANDPNALGFFGLAYYVENQDKLKAVAIKNPETGECVKPSVQTATDGEYQPLTRPLLIYVNADSAKQAHIQEFVSYYLDPGFAQEIVSAVGYAPLSTEAYRLARQNFEQRETGTAFAGGSQIGVSAQELLAMQRQD